MRGVDHQPLGRFLFTRQFHKDAVEYAQSAPAHETVINSYTVSCAARIPGGHPSIAAHPNDVDDPADHPQIINRGNSVGKGKISFYTVELCSRQEKKTPHGSTPPKSKSHLTLFV